MNGLRDLKAIQQRLRKLPIFYERLLSRLGRKCVEKLKAYTPGKDLPNEWNYDVTMSGDAASMRVYTTRYEQGEEWLLILFWLNLGTKRHWVEPVNAQALHWIDKATGEHRFSKGHEVSGITPSFFAEQCDDTIHVFIKTIDSSFNNYMSTGKLPS